MASPEVKRFVLPAVILSAAVLVVVGIGHAISDAKNALTDFGNRESNSAFPFPNRSTETIAPTPIISPSEVVTTPAPVESSDTPFITPSPTTTAADNESPTPMPTPTPARPTASPTKIPLGIKIVGSDYKATSAHSGLAYLYTETTEPEKRTHSAEFNVQCGSYVVKVGVASYTNGDLIFYQDPVQHPELTTRLCKDKQVRPDLIEDPTIYAGYLLKLA